MISITSSACFPTTEHHKEKEYRTKCFIMLIRNCWCQLASVLPYTSPYSFTLSPFLCSSSSSFFPHPSISLNSLPLPSAAIFLLDHHGHCVQEIGGEKLKLFVFLHFCYLRTLSSHSFTFTPQCRSIELRNCHWAKFSDRTTVPG